jgi:hypothetical protein
LIKHWIVGLNAALLCVSSLAKEPTKAAESSYNNDIMAANSSTGLTNADLAWHAQNTFGFDCAEVVARTEAMADGDYQITCANGTHLHVHPRARRYPLISGAEMGAK